MHHVINSALGIAAAALGSALVSLGSAVLAGYVSHPLESLPWLLAVSILPAGIGGVALGLIPAPSWHGALRTWGLVALVGFVVVAAAGSVGAIALQSIRIGYSNVNAVGYFAWCGVYGLVLLPISVPLAALTGRIVWRLNGRGDR